MNVGIKNYLVFYKKKINGKTARQTTQRQFENTPTARSIWIYFHFLNILFGHEHKYILAFGISSMLKYRFTAKKDGTCNF